MRFSTFFFRTLWHVGPILAAALVLMLVKFVDQSIPVVTNFNITNQVVIPTGVMIEGTMEKQRDCEFQEVLAYANKRPVQVRFLDKDESSPSYTRAVRVQLWGPWEINSGTARTVTIYARHSCHIFWGHTTELTKLSIVGVTAK